VPASTLRARFPPTPPYPVSRGGAAGRGQGRHGRCARPLHRRGCTADLVHRLREDVAATLYLRSMVRRAWAVAARPPCSSTPLRRASGQHFRRQLPTSTGGTLRQRLPASTGSRRRWRGTLGRSCPCRIHQGPHLRHVN
jgi:hypothetical protein